MVYLGFIISGSGAEENAVFLVCMVVADVEPEIPFLFHLAQTFWN
jgi:hypothetical protein